MLEKFKLLMPTFDYATNVYNLHSSESSRLDINIAEKCVYKTINKEPTIKVDFHRCVFL